MDDHCLHVFYLPYDLQRCWINLREVSCLIAWWWLIVAMLAGYAVARIQHADEQIEYWIEGDTDEPN